MSDLISRQAAIKAFYIQSDDDGWWVGTAQDAETLLNGLPSAEKVGKWKYETMSHIITGEMRTVRICSECGGGWFRYDLSDGVEDAEPNYCPNCGARMDEVTE